MFKHYAFVFLFSSFLCVDPVFAQESNALSEKSQAEIKAKLAGSINLDIKSIKASPFPSMVEVITNQGLFYASKDGKFLVQGKLYGIGSDDVVNHTEDSLSLLRIEGLKEFSNDMIVYPAKEEKHQITVFTDITCGYCRKMHKQIDEYNDLGITVKYMAYPRSGVKDQLGRLSQGFKDLQSIWCHEEPSVALTKAKLGSSVAQRICESPVEAEFDFGRQIGVNSTPAIIFPNGMLLPGYREPKDLIKILESISAES
ncbi:MAG: bifunctional protein-disulfide isomerase/oxidoreductase DsbC [Thalassotalea sp.]|nr:bifunctional protein-disulfide isomerase/oxidoreductase DsbC [Thalassotalea sp.]